MANPTIVLIHGAFADASGFRGLHDQLLGQDVTVIAPPNPLRGLILQPDFVTCGERALDAERPPFDDHGL
jgi:hypothetical protein